MATAEELRAMNTPLINELTAEQLDSILSGMDGDRILTAALRILDWSGVPHGTPERRILLHTMAATRTLTDILEGVTS